MSDRGSARDRVAAHDPLEDILGAEIAYVAHWRRLTAAVRRATRLHVERELASIVGDGGPGAKRRLEQALERMEAAIRKAMPREELEAAAAEQAARVANVSEARFTASVDERLEQARAEDDDDAMLAFSYVREQGRGASLERTNARFAKRNVKLAADVVKKHRRNLNKDIGDVLAGAAAWLTIKDIEKREQAKREAIRKAMSKSRDTVTERIAQMERRGDLIAQDQTEKLSGEHDEARHRSAGIDAYIWRTMRDERVRPWHKTREGKRVRWDTPPFDGHASRPPLCRCWARPDLERGVDVKAFAELARKHGVKIAPHRR